LALLAGPLAGTAAAQTTYTVTTTADSGSGSLREAIVDANSTAGADEIHFNIPGTGVKTIAPTSELPTISDSVTIDGYTQPGATPNTNPTGALNSVQRIEINGSGTTGVPGVTISSGSSVVKGLVINRFLGPQILVNDLGSNQIGGNYLGTNAAGTAAAGAGYGPGISVDGSDSNLVGAWFLTAMRNLISGNGTHGIQILNGGELNGVQGNLVGTNKAGMAALPNSGAGVLIDSSDFNTVGVATASGRNVLSGNTQEGVQLNSADLNSVFGNYIGTSANGRSNLGNGTFGVADFTGQNNVIGGSATAERNLVSGNLSGGVLANSEATRVIGNYIGLDVTGATALGNVGTGVTLLGINSVVGGTDPGARNVISGNLTAGVVDSGTSNTVAQNFIGTTANGAGARGNGGDGIVVFGGSSSIGANDSSGRNVVAGNGGDGIEVSAGSSVQVRGNYVGIGATGAVLPNAENGVRLTAGATGASVGGNSGTPGAPPGNVISGNDGSGVLIEGSATTSNVVSSNFIGTNPAGNAAVPNANDGVTIQDGARGTQIGGPARLNVISGNGLSGVFMVGAGTTQNNLDDNLVGLNAVGTAAVPNGNGVEVADGASGNRVGLPGSGRTVVAGNRYEGVFIHGAGTRQNLVQDAYVGVRANGSTAAPNGTGVEISGGAQLNIVGGGQASQRNVISGNHGAGVAIAGLGTNRNTARGNYVGTRSDGNGAVPNDVGVDVFDRARSNTVRDSLISGNTATGVRVAGPGTLDNRLQGNLIGTRESGTTGLPNGLGVLVADGARDTAVTDGAIAFNTGDGVLVEGAATNGTNVHRSRIFRNAGLGVNLRPAGEGPSLVTPNDPGDVDSGPNRLQNFPVITTATVSGGSTTIAGTLNSTPSSTFRIDVYRNPSTVTPALSEAENYVGTVTATTDAVGDAIWSLTVPTAHAGEHFRATATNAATLDTSELSAAVTAS
jgi:titin